MGEFSLLLILVLSLFRSLTSGRATAGRRPDRCDCC